MPGSKDPTYSEIYQCSLKSKHKILTSSGLLWNFGYRDKISVMVGTSVSNHRWRMQNVFRKHAWISSFRLFAKDLNFAIWSILLEPETKINIKKLIHIRRLLLERLTDSSISFIIRKRLFLVGFIKQCSCRPQNITIL